MRYWVNSITFMAILALVLGTGFAYTQQYEWLKGTVALPNYELAFTDTKIDIIYTNTQSGQQLQQSVVLKKMKNTVPFAMLIPEGDEAFTLHYSLADNDVTNVMRIAYQDAGGVATDRKTVALSKQASFKVDDLKGYVLRVELLENTSAWQEAQSIVDQLWKPHERDRENVERLIRYIRNQELEAPQLALRWLLCHADTESELLWVKATPQAPEQLMNAVFLEGIYNFIDIRDPQGVLIDRSELTKRYPHRRFEQGVDR